MSDQETIEKVKAALGVCSGDDLLARIGKLLTLEVAAKSLFDNRLGWSENRPPYAPRHFWHQLAVALYGHADPRAADLTTFEDEKVS